MNTIGTGTYGTTYRAKYFASTLQHTLKNALVAEAVCQVDRTDLKYIHNPYSNRPTAYVQSLTGTYSVSAWTTTDDSLTLTDEFVYGEHIFDFERVTSRYDLFKDRIGEMSWAVAQAIDIWVLNELCENGTGTYTTPAGGFTTAGNIPVIISNLASKVMGYSENMNGQFLVIENTDTVGFMQYQFSTGFSYADAALNNGFIGHLGGVDIYVVRSGTFVDAATTSVSGSKTWTNSGHRVFGIKKMATYAQPRGVTYDEKGDTGKTGKEIAVAGYSGFKLWNSKLALIVDITLA